MLNQVVLIGRVTHDLELRHTSSNGVPVATYNIAVDRPFKNKGGEKETDFISIVTWRKLAENCANYIGKGSLVAVTGRLQIRSYEDKEGSNRKVTEVVADDVRFLSQPKKKTADDMIDGATEVDPDDMPF